MKHKWLTIEQLAIVVKTQRKKAPTINLGTIEQALKDLPPIPIFEKQCWIENGIQYETYKMTTDTTTIWTGSGGAKLLEEAFKERGIQFKN